MLRVTRILLAAAAGLWAGCGGGGGGGPPEPIEFEVEFQLVAADRNTAKIISINNPIDGVDADVELAPDQDLTGPFAPAAGALPGFVAAGGSFDLRVVFTPPAPGDYAGEVTLRFRFGNYYQDVIVLLSAEVEELFPALSGAPLAFGDILVGEERTLSFTVRNPAVLTDLDITSLSTLPAGFDYDGTVVPFSVAPGAVRAIPVRYDPDAPDVFSFTIEVQHTAQGGPLRVPVTAQTSTWPALQVFDLGPVAVTGGETDWLEVEVPPHGISLSLEARVGGNQVIGLLGWEGPDGRIYENEDLTGEFLWTPSSEGVFAATVPQNDNPNLQVVPGGGTYRFRFFLLVGTAATMDVRAIVANRLGGTVAGGRLTLNVFLADGLGISAGAARNEPRLQEIVTETDAIFAQQGLRIGEIEYYRLTDPAYDAVTSEAEFAALLEESAVATETRHNVFFVQTALGGGVLGVAAAVPGPRLNGSGVSGVMVDYDFGSSATAGRVTAHEIGHYLGLFHTVERNGSHDIINDTLECPANGTDNVCTTEGAGYLMHWRILGGNPVITDGQAGVILAHPLVDPLFGGLTGRLPRPPSGPTDPLPDGWCGTPGCCRKR